MIHTDTTGYRIACAVDATMVTDLLVERPDHVDRLAALEEALDLWHGEALDEFRHEEWAAPEAARLDELRALAVEDHAELLSSRAGAGEAVASLEALVDANPLRALGSPAIEVLRSAAVLGAEFADDVLAGRTELEDEVVVDALDLTMGAGLLGEAGNMVDPRRFTHSFVQHAQYSEPPWASGGDSTSGRPTCWGASRSPDRTSSWPSPGTPHSPVTSPPRSAGPSRPPTTRLSTSPPQKLPPGTSGRSPSPVIGRPPTPNAPDSWCCWAKLRSVPGDPRTHAALLEAATLARQIGTTDVLVRAALANHRGVLAARR